MNLIDRNNKQKEFFNEKIDSYDDVHEKYMKTKNELINSLNKEAKKILDLGAGTGLELIHLYEAIPDAEVIAIDISENMLNKLKTRSFADKVTTICGDFFEVDFGKNYDAVISTSALHHFKKEEKYILYKKIYECLKNDGLFINCDKICKNEDEQEYWLNELENNFNNYKHIDTPLTIENEVKILDDLGFKDIHNLNVDKEDYSLIIARK